MERKTIRSLQNPRIRAVRRLHKRRERDRHGLMLIEGGRELSIALACGLQVEEVLLCPELVANDDERRLIDELKSRDITICEISSRVLGKMVYREGSSCCMAVARQPSRTMEELPSHDNPFYMVVDSVEKPGNLGALFRSADASGVTGLILSDPGTDLFNPNVIRSSIGTVFSVRAAVTDPQSAISWLRRRNIGIMVSTPSQGILYTETNFTSPCAVVVGSEDRGASAAWFNASNENIYIQMRGNADSLNVSAAATVIMYEALRQRSAVG